MGSQIDHQVRSALLLAAGYGTRLRPLTTHLPKALVPVADRPLLDYHFEALAQARVRKVILNASHLAQHLAAWVRSAAGYGLEVVLSLERPEPLGTGGGLRRVRDLLEHEPAFLVINADSFHSVDLRRVVRHHARSGADATLVLRAAAGGAMADPISVDARGAVTAVPGMPGAAAPRRWEFTGIHVLTPAILPFLPERGSIFAGYRGLLANSAHVGCFDASDAAWIDIGTPADYLAANLVAIQDEGTKSWAAAEVHPRARLRSPLLLGSGAQVEADCTLGPSAVIGHDAVISEECQVTHSVVWASVRLPPKRVLDHCIAHPSGTVHVAGPLRG